MNKKKSIKVKFKCSECGKIHYRVRREYYEEKLLYCTFCQEPILEEQ